MPPGKTSTGFAWAVAKPHKGMDHMYQPPKQLKVFHLSPGLQFSWILWYCCVPGVTWWAPVQFAYEQLFYFWGFFSPSLPPSAVFPLHFNMCFNEVNWFLHLRLFRMPLEMYNPQQQSMPSTQPWSYSQGIPSKQGSLTHLPWLPLDAGLHLSHCSEILCSWFAS